MEQPIMMGIGTAVPPHVLDQRETAQRLKDNLSDYPDAARWAQRIFARSGVDRRYTCEPNLLEGGERSRYFPASFDRAGVPTTRERMDVYRRESVAIAERAARLALDDARLRAGDVTHLIAVSCTGIYLPGLDAELTTRLELSTDVNRIPLTFLGCAAGLTAIRMADRIVRHEPQAKVLVATVELCTLHIQPSFEKEELYSASFFGDGASACVVGMPDRRGEGVFEIRGASSAIIPGTADMMGWTVGNHGFLLRLSSQIPRLIGQVVPPAFERFWGGGSMPELWAIHPGGKGIVDALQTAFRLEESQTETSRSVLRDYGNMSSATILFVLERLRERERRSASDARPGVALAFGPGMAAEMLRFSYRP
ncbi:type III polyketide synthase [Paenibacillaceae bacterium WGS1546]|uniref:type III polyketide synthase n=1 Tax=Cohnella sp. WGS1546 TaxID=3366810 RepID=UPI00372D00C6